MHFMGHGIEKAYGADTSAKASGVHSEMATAQQHLLAQIEIRIKNLKSTPCLSLNACLYPFNIVFPIFPSNPGVLVRLDPKW
jgi:hypothetical protein